MKALFAAAFIAVCGGSAAAQDARPRWTEDLSALDFADRDARGGEPDRAAARFAKLLDDPDTADIFVGDPSQLGTVRGLRATARDRARALAAELPAFRKEWELLAASWLSRLAGDSSRAGLEKVASLFRGTPAASEALQQLAELAWEAGDPVRAAEYWERSGADLTPKVAARVALGRRAAGLGAPAGEWARRWEEVGTCGVRPKFPARWFPPLSAPLEVRGEMTTLGAFLARVPPVRLSPWRGELNGGETPFPAFKSIAGPPQVVTLFTMLPPDGKQQGPSRGVVFRDPGAYDGASPVRIVPFGNRVVAATRSGLAVVARGADGKWRLAGGVKPSAPLAGASVATDGRRLFTVIPDPRTPQGAVRMVTAAFSFEGEELKAQWMNGPTAESAPSDETWSTGPPLLDGGRLYAPVAFVAGAYEPALECLDAVTGERLWVTPLAEATREAFSASTRVSSSPPAMAGGLVLVEPSLGFVAALDPATGDPEWLHLYSASRGMVGGWADAPPRFAGRRALFAPLDATEALRLDVQTGLSAVNTAPAAFPAFRYALADGTRAVLAGSDGALAGEGGPRGLVKVLNPFASRDVLFELPDPPAGRPAAWGGVLTVPTSRGLVALDLETGALKMLVAWKPEDAGDVVRIPGWLIVVRDGELRFWEVRE